MTHSVRSLMRLLIYCRSPDKYNYCLRSRPVDPDVVSQSMAILKMSDRMTGSFADDWLYGIFLSTLIQKCLVVDLNWEEGSRYWKELFRWSTSILTWVFQHSHWLDSSSCSSSCPWASKLEWMNMNMSNFYSHFVMPTNVLFALRVKVFEKREVTVNVCDVGQMENELIQRHYLKHVHLELLKWMLIMH